MSICGAPVASVHPSTPPDAMPPAIGASGSSGADGSTPWSREDLVDVVPVLLADHLPELRAEVLGVAAEAELAVRRLHRHDHVDAVGLAVDVLVDPLQLELELLVA